MFLVLFKDGMQGGSSGGRNAVILRVEHAIKQQNYGTYFHRGTPSCLAEF